MQNGIVLRDNLLGAAFQACLLSCPQSPFHASRTRQDSALYEELKSTRDFFSSFIIRVASFTSFFVLSSHRETCEGNWLFQLQVRARPHPPPLLFGWLAVLLFNPELPTPRGAVLAFFPYGWSCGLAQGQPFQDLPSTHLQCRYVSPESHSRYDLNREFYFETFISCSKWDFAASMSDLKIHSLPVYSSYIRASGKPLIPTDRWEWVVCWISIMRYCNAKSEIPNKNNVNAQLRISISEISHFWESFC